MFNGKAWLDLYGEDGIEPEPKREGVYCRNCDDYIERKEMKRWVKDDDTIDLLCPGSDETLIEDI